MNIDWFMKHFSEVLLNDKNDHIFESLKTIMGGTTSPRIGKLLNFAVSQMDHSECYVEVGVFTGTTLCSANHQNKKDCIGIDKFDVYELGKMTTLEPSNIRDRALFNIKCMGDGSRLIEKDFNDVTQADIIKPVAVSFIDGTHTYEEVHRNLFWLHPFLAERAILVFDDVNYQEVTEAIFDWIDAHPDYDLVAYVKPYYQDDRYMSSIEQRFLNNGVAILRYHKNLEEKCLILPEIRPTKGDPHAN